LYPQYLHENGGVLQSSARNRLHSSISQFIIRPQPVVDTNVVWDNVIVEN
jgi:hypothetical protein